MDCTRNPEHPPYKGKRCPACKVESTQGSRNRRKELRMVPAAPVIEVMRKYMREHADDCRLGTRSGDAYFDSTGIQPVAKALGITERRIRDILQKERITFDLADRIITRLDVLAWHLDPELNKIYNSVPLDQIDGRLQRQTKEGVREGTQKWLAEKIGVSSVTVSRVLRKEKRAASPDLTKHILAEAKKAGML